MARSARDRVPEVDLPDIVTQPPSNLEPVAEIPPATTQAIPPEAPREAIPPSQQAPVAIPEASEQQIPSTPARVTVNYQVPARGLPGMHQRVTNPVTTPGVTARNRTNVEYLSNLVSDPNRQNYQIEVRRVGPAKYQGIELPCGPVDRTHPMTFQEIQKRTQELNGGGDYRIAVFNDDGAQIMTMPFNIPLLISPPKLRQMGDDEGVSMFPSLSPSGQTFAGSLANNPFSRANRPPATMAAAEEDEIVKLRNEERKTSAEMAVALKRREKDRLEAQIADEEEARRERKSGKNKNEDTKFEIFKIESESRFERLMLMIQQQQKETAAMITAATAKKDDGGAAALQMQLMIKSMEMQSQMMIAMMQGNQAALTAKQHEQVEAAKIQAENQKQMMDMMLKSTQGGNSRTDKLFETVLMQSLNKNENSITQALEMMDRGRQQSMEMFELLDQRRSEDESFSFDPEGGFLGNIGKALFGLLKGAMRGGGANAQSIAQMLNKDPNNISDSELANLARRMEGQQRPQLPMYPQQNQMVVQQPQPVQPIAVPNMPRINPIAEIYEEDVLQQAAPVQQVHQHADNVTPIRGGDEYVNEALNIAIDDVQNGRSEHEWADYAIGKWPRVLLEALVRAPDDAAKIELIRSAASPEIFGPLQMLLLDTTKPYNYSNFIKALQGLVLEFAQANGMTVIPNVA